MFAGLDPWPEKGTKVEVRWLGEKNPKPLKNINVKMNINKYGQVDNIKFVPVKVRASEMKHNN